jgi:hypothetical protein
MVISSNKRHPDQSSNLWLVIEFIDSKKRLPRGSLFLLIYKELAKQKL